VRGDEGPHDGQPQTRATAGRADTRGVGAVETVEHVPGLRLGEPRPVVGHLQHGTRPDGADTDADRRAVAEERGGDAEALAHAQ
jgi:hypothetical protein